MNTYRIDRRPEAVAEVQRYLRAISYKHESVPHIGIDGIFGKETADAVRAFQLLFLLQETGGVDAATFALLYKEFLSLSVHGE